MKSVASTQENVPIAGVKNGIIILKDGQYRMVLEITAINFSLKSEEEQNSLVLQYQGFLNSIHFPIQIVIRSRQLDLAPYINKIKALSEKQTNELLKIQTTDYVDFVGQLIDLANIMKKSFYVVIGYQPLTVGQGTILDKLFSRKQQVNLKISDEEFAHNTKELTQRGQNVAQGLGSMGLHCKQLNTEEVIELFYGIYNPEVASKERLTESNNVSSAYVTSSKKEKSPDQTVNLDSKAKEPTIDNQAIVEEQEKNKAKERAFEEQSTEQRSIGMTKPGPAPKATEEKKDQKTEAQNSPPASPNPSPTENNQNNQNQPEPANQTPVQNQQTAEQQAVSDPTINKGYGN